jgi:3-mercaptopyruvate sulfurtransferase SseA
MLIQMNLENTRSYKTKKNLDKALERFGFNTHRHLVACKDDGTFTAIFPASNFRDGGYIGLYSQHGFMTFG